MSRFRPTTTAWLALYLVILLTGTWSPLNPGTLLAPISVESSETDLFLNLALFLPLGLAMRRHSKVRIALVAFALSALIETGQLFLLRSPSPLDLAMNTLGAFLGSWLPPLRWTRLRRTLLGCAMLLAGAGMIALVAVAASQRVAVSFTGWESMPLVVAGELDAPRRFRGAIRRLEIHAARLGDSELRRAIHLGATPESLIWRLEASAEGLRVRSRAASNSRLESDGVVLPPGARLSERGVHAAGAAWKQDRVYAQRILAAFRERTASGAPPGLTVIARVTPADSDLASETRILNFGRSLWRRNFSLGTLEGRTDWRVRSNVTDVAGNGPGLRSYRSHLHAGREVTLIGRFGPRESRIDVADPPSAPPQPSGQLRLAPHTAPFPLGLGGPAFLALATALATLGLRALGAGRRGSWLGLVTLGVVVLAFADWSFLSGEPLGARAFASFEAGNWLLLPSLASFACAARAGRVFEESGPSQS